MKYNKHTHDGEVIALIMYGEAVLADLAITYSQSAGAN